MRERLGYYPGCSAEGTSKDFDASLREVLFRMGVSLQEIPDWNCCGASPGHVLREELGAALSYLNLLKANKAALEEILVACPSCYSNLLKARHLCMEDPEIASRWSELYGAMEGDPPVVRHLLEYLVEEVGEKGIKAPLRRPLEGLKVVPYYGCLNRLPYVEMDDKENPVFMDQVLSWLGAEVIDWSYKNNCCGAGLSVPRSEVTRELAARLLQAARDHGAEVISVVCPLCQFNLDSQQGYAGTDIPVLYLPQLIGVAFSLREDDLCLSMPLVEPTSLFRAKGLL